MIALNPIEIALIAKAKRMIPTMASPISHSRDCHIAFSRLAGFCVGTGSRLTREGRMSTRVFGGFRCLLTHSRLRAHAYRHLSAARKFYSTVTSGHA